MSDKAIKNPHTRKQKSANICLAGHCAARLCCFAPLSHHHEVRDTPLPLLVASLAGRTVPPSYPFVFQSRGMVTGRLTCIQWHPGRSSLPSRTHLSSWPKCSRNRSDAHAHPGAIFSFLQAVAHRRPGLVPPSSGMEPGPVVHEHSKRWPCRRQERLGQQSAVG